MARKSSLVAVAVVLVGVLVGGASAVFPYGYYGTPSVLYHPYYSAPPISQPVTYTGLPMRPISLRAEEVMVLPCPGEGFFVHPTNSSRFYRCVDHTGTGRFFVRYIFECAPGFVFNPEPKVQTCIPRADSVLGSTQPPTTGPSTDAPVPSTNPPATPPSSTDPPVPSVPPTDPPVPSTPTDPPVTQPPVTDLPVPPTESTAPPTPDDSCKGQYVQHEMYCNVYRRCNDTSKRYMCPQGTAFSEQRQMCRIGAADEELCVGKIVAAVSSQLRTELVDGHILLPDDAVLVPLLTSPLTASHVAPHILTLRTPNVPQPHPYNFPSPGSSFAAIPYSTVVKPQSLSLVRPRPLTSPYAATGYDSQPVTVNNVRKPQKHLHFPNFFPYAQGDSNLGYGSPYYRDPSTGYGNLPLGYQSPQVVPGNPNFAYSPLFP